MFLEDVLALLIDMETIVNIKDALVVYVTLILTLLTQYHAFIAMVVAHAIMELVFVIQDIQA